VGTLLPPDLAISSSGHVTHHTHIPIDTQSLIVKLSNCQIVKLPNCQIANTKNASAESADASHYVSIYRQPFSLPSLPSLPKSLAIPIPIPTHDHDSVTTVRLLLSVTSADRTTLRHMTGSTKPTILPIAFITDQAILSFVLRFRCILSSSPTAAPSPSCPPAFNVSHLLNSVTPGQAEAFALLLR
jgi:hypothetical protein